jgi:transcriptional regulator
MYNPSHFREDRIEVIHQLIREHTLATLVTLGPDGLLASHLPLILDPDPAPLGTLRGHLARANPQWKELDPKISALAIFQGPQAYISPNWYATKSETGKVVPTFNYVAVHAYGPLEVITDPALILEHVRALTRHHEARFPEPWQVEDAPADFIESQLKAIVGLKIPIARLEGKWKTSQNRPEADRAGVVEGLKDLGDPDSRAMADLVTRLNGGA